MNTINFLTQIYYQKPIKQSIDNIWKEFIKSLNIKRELRPTRIVCCFGVYGTAYWRVFIPMMELSLNPEFDIKVTVHLDDEIIKWADIIVFHRSASREIYDKFLMAKKLGKKLVFDTDDFLHNHPTYNPSKKSIENSPYIDYVSDMIRQSHALTVSTLVLESKYKNFNNNISVLPNSVNLEHWNYKKCLKTDTINLGWSGTNTHSKDVEVIAPAVKEIMNKYDNVRLMTVGWDGIYYFDNGRTVFYEDYLSDIPIEKRIDFHWTDFCHLVGKYISNIDIGLAPLLDNEFNRCKSAVKYLEYASLYIPTIATDIEAYKCINHNQTGLLVKNNRYTDWYKCIDNLIKNPEQRYQMGINAYQDIQEKWNIKNNVKLWEETYKNLLK